MLRSYLNRLYECCGYIAAAFMIGIAIAILTQIIARTRGVTFDATEAAGLCLAASTFFGLAHTFRHGSHVRINLILLRLAPGHRRKFEIANCLLGAVVVSFLGWHVLKFAIQSYHFNDVSPGLLAIPFWIPQAGVAVGIVVFAIALVDELVWLLGKGEPRYEAPDEVEHSQSVA